MIIKFIKITSILITFIFLTGFFPLLSLIGPSYTAMSSGSIYKASAQYFINKGIKNKTGKNSLDFVKEKIDKKKSSNDLNHKILKLVEKRFHLARKKLNLENINQ